MHKFVVSQMKSFNISFSVTNTEGNTSCPLVAECVWNCAEVRLGLLLCSLSDFYIQALPI